MSEQENLNTAMTGEATIPGPSNTARFYKAQFDAVVEAFDNGEEEFAFRDACIDLLNDPLLPLKYRVQCGYMMAHASDEPEKEVEKAMAIVKVIEEKIGDDGLLPDWLIKIKSEFERVLPGMKEMAAQIDDMSEEELKEHIAAEDPDEREESPVASSVKALTSVPGLTYTTTATEPVIPTSSPTAHSPVIHPEVEKYEDDAEMLLRSPGGDDITDDAVGDIASRMHGTKRARSSSPLEESSDSGQRSEMLLDTEYRTTEPREASPDMLLDSGEESPGMLLGSDDDDDASEVEGEPEEEETGNGDEKDNEDDEGNDDDDEEDDSEDGKDRGDGDGDDADVDV